MRVGLHWQSPVIPASEGTRRQIGLGIEATLLLSHTDVPPAGEENVRQHIAWLCTGNRHVVIRLYYPATRSLPPARELALQWANLVRYSNRQGVISFQVLNEIDLEHEGVPAAYMADLAIAVRESVAGQSIALGFPGPIGNVYPGTADWDRFWQEHQPVVTAHYDWIALHAYPAIGGGLAGLPGLREHAQRQLTDIGQRFADCPVLFTEYGIPLDHVQGDRLRRAEAYAEFLWWLERIWGARVQAAYAFIAADSPGWEAYALTDEEVEVLVRANVEKGDSAMDDSALLVILGAEFRDRFQDWRGELADSIPAGQPGGVPLRSDMQQIEHWAIHHSAVPATVGPREIYNWHRRNNGWVGIGYHFCVGDAGQVWYTRHVGQWGINVKGKNDRVVGICLLGDFTASIPPEAQLEATARLCRCLDEWLGRRLPRTPHRALVSTTCPGNLYEQWIPRLSVAPSDSDRLQQELQNLRAVVEKQRQALQAIAKLAQEHVT